MNEFSRLLDAWKDGAISDADRERLERMLEDPGIRRSVVAACVDEATFTAAFREEGRDAVALPMASAREPLFRQTLDAMTGAVGLAIASLGARPIRAGAIVATIAAVLVLLTLSTQDRPLLAPQSGATLVRGSTERRLDRPVRLAAGDVVRTSTDRGAELSYKDGSQIVLQPGAEMRVDADRAKRLLLARGTVQVSAAKQRPDRPLVIATAESEMTVVGTRFLATARPGSTWLAVEEGRVRIQSKAPPAETAMVGAMQFAVAAGGVPLKSRPFAGAMDAIRAIEIPVDWASPILKGDGQWQVRNGVLSQSKVSTRPVWPMLWSTPKDPTSSLEILSTISGSLLIETRAEVRKLPGPEVPPDGRWGGFACRVGFSDKLLKLYFADDGDAGKLVLSLVDTEPGRLGKDLALVKTMPFAVGEYRVKLLIQRIDDSRAVAKGKLWQAGVPEPADWTVAADVSLTEPIHRFAIETTHCACEFRDFKAHVVQ